MNTNEVRNNKWYLLISSEQAEWLIDKTYTTVLFASYGRPSIKVTKDNFEWCNVQNLDSHNKAVSGNYFIIEYTLPSLKIEATEKGYTLNSQYRTPFEAYSFDSVEVWREKEIERRLNELGSYLELDRVRKEVDDELKQLPL
jgi:hypothetical protein